VTVTIDASVWVAAGAGDEAAHTECRDFLRAVLSAGVEIHLPSLSLVEVTAAVARRTRDPVLAREAGLALLGAPGVVFHGLDLGSASSAAAIAGRTFLRGADAIYAATALAAGSTLVTLDEQLAARASGAVAVTTPARWRAGRQR
jgi:predicted nucleic acid-binding protein